jgi:hypothetical protein
VAPIRLLDRLASGPFLVGLAAAWVAFYVPYALWFPEAFAGFIAMLGSNPLLQVPYLLFVLSSALWLWRRAHVQGHEGALRRLGGLLLPLGLWLFLLGFGMSAMLRQHHWDFLQEGEFLQLPWQTTPWRLQELRPPFEDRYVQSTAASPLFLHEPELTLRSGDQTRTLGAFPPTRVRDSRCNILDFGLAPTVRALLPDGRTIEDRPVQRLLPPGVEDDFELPGLPWRIGLRMVPSDYAEGDSGADKIYRLRAPTYRVVVREGNEVLYEGEVQTEAALPQGAFLQFDTPSYWAWVQCARDPGFRPLVLGLVLIVIGAPIALLRWGITLGRAMRS